MKLGDIIDNYYDIYLTKSLICQMNIMKNLTLKIWYTWQRHLSYNKIQKLAFVALNKKFEGLLLSKTYKYCIINKL